METSSAVPVTVPRGRYLASLDADLHRLVEVGAGVAARPVPSCPDWTVDDLLRHVTEVYQHKVACMRLGRAPQGWPPPRGTEPAPAGLCRAYAELLGEFERRSAAEPSYTWYEPDQTVGFWLRRMAQETLIHRYDAELAAGAPSAVPDDLAVDGIDEFLVAFLGFQTRRYADDEDVAPLLAGVGGRALAVRAGGVGWLAEPGPAGVAVSRLPAGPAAAERAAVAVSGEPAALLLWLWGRGGDGAVTVSGDPAALTAHRALLVEVSQ
jgi:uncharacterized protein (TIGR03083 family)